jgi:hypothetical protein
LTKKRGRELKGELLVVNKGEVSLARSRLATSKLVWKEVNSHREEGKEKRRKAGVRLAYKPLS